jgi:hypothetical protein
MTLLERDGRTPEERKRAKAQRRRLHPRWPAWVPVFVALVVIGMPFFLLKLITVLVALAVIVAVGRRPAVALTALLIGMPFQLLIFSGLYRYAVPAEVVRPLGQWKEILIIGVLVAGFRKATKENHKLDRLDWFALGYVGLGTAYLVVPGLFTGTSGLGATLDFTTRLIGWRTDIMYVALFLACRHLRLPSEVVVRLVRTFLIVATVVAVVGVFEYLFSSTWNNFVVNTLGLTQYKLDILKLTPLQDRQLYDIRVYTSVGGIQVLRVGSTLLQYWALGFYMVIAAAALSDRIVRGTARRWHYVALVLCGAAVLLTQTRSAILGLSVVLAATLVRRSGRTIQGAGARIRFSLIVGAIAAVAIPAAFALGLVSRFNGEDDYSSNDSHQGSLNVGYGILVDHPLGRGLATAAGAGQRADVEGNVVTETQLLQIGTQLGLLGLALWVGVVLTSIIVLNRAASRAPPWVDTSAATGMRIALIGLLVAGTFLQVYIDFALSWAVWSLAGAGLGAIEHATAHSTADSVTAPALPPRPSSRTPWRP